MNLKVFPDLAADSEKCKRGERRPQKKPRKVLIVLRLERSTVEAYKAGGRGYGTPEGQKLPRVPASLVAWAQ